MDIHHYIHFDDDILQLLTKINKKVNTLMATMQELTDAMAIISTEVDKVSADTDNILAQLAAIPPGGQTSEQQAALDSAVASANAIAGRLQTLDQKVPEPTPPPFQFPA